MLEVGYWKLDVVRSKFEVRSVAAATAAAPAAFVVAATAAAGAGAVCIVLVAGPLPNREMVT